MLRALRSEIQSMDRNELIIEQLLDFAYLILGRYARAEFSVDNKNSNIYVARRDALLKRIQEMDYIARIHVGSPNSQTQQLLQALRHRASEQGPDDFYEYETVLSVLESPDVVIKFSPELEGDANLDPEQLKHFAYQSLTMMRKFEELPEELFPDV